MKISVFWFRRDLRLQDNTALFHALNSEHEILPVFIFDEEIISELPKDDGRISFIHESLQAINQSLNTFNSSIRVEKGNPMEVWTQLISKYEIDTVFANKDYEPYARKRDTEIHQLLAKNNIAFKLYKDQVIFEESEITKSDGLPYTMFTPYKNKWHEKFQYIDSPPLPFPKKPNFKEKSFDLPALNALGFEKSGIHVQPYTLDAISDYENTRNFPSLDSTSYLSPHLRFGTIGIRQLIAQIPIANTPFINELIWREFFMQILFHFPEVTHHNFKSKYNGVKWRNDETEFQKWCDGQTGYPIVDAGMRQLNETGYMHNRVRMITAGFLCKHLLIDWKWGEAYFANKLLDYELSSNNGNWQWAAGTGCDSAPYFRIFNPTEQIKKFDKNLEYINTWVPEFNSLEYPLPMVEHKFARERALSVYKEGLSSVPFK